MWGVNIAGGGGGFHPILRIPAREKSVSGENLPKGQRKNLASTPKKKC